jgi:hypothetical protein
VIPRKPESIEALKARYSKALERLYDVEIISGNNYEGRPSLYPEHIFDFQDGFRLIISREKYDDRMFVHVSGSCQRLLSGEEMIQGMMNHIMEIGGIKLGLGEATATPGGIFHIVYELDKDGKPLPMPKIKLKPADSRVQNGQIDLDNSISQN